jgi:hypothetical protein
LSEEIHKSELIAALRNVLDALGDVETNISIYFKECYPYSAEVEQKRERYSEVRDPLIVAGDKISEAIKVLEMIR